MNVESLLTDGGMEAPSCVVGFQFSHELMYERFMELTSTIDVSSKISIENKFLFTYGLSPQSATIAKGHAEMTSKFAMSSTTMATS